MLVSIAYRKYSYPSCVNGIPHGKKYNRREMAIIPIISKEKIGFLNKKLCFLSIFSTYNIF